MRNFAPQMEKDMQSYRLSDLVKIKKWQRPQDAFKREIPCSWKWGHYALC